MRNLGSLNRGVTTVLIAGLLAVRWQASPAAQEQAAAAPAECAAAGECLCDSSYQDCRSPILQLINNETVGIDVSFWFMSDWRYASALSKRWQAGVPVRVILDTKADANYAGNTSVRDTLVNAGIPIRNYHGAAINHWKMMLFAGQGKVEFSAANYADGSYCPSPLTSPYLRYVDEAIYFTDDHAIVDSFMTKFDEQWVDTTTFVNFANITSPLARAYDTYPVSPDLNFVPDQNFESRLASQIQYENQQIDATIFRITSARIPDALIARHKAGVPVRLITEPRQYRNTTYMWDAYNVDRMYAAGIHIKMKNNTTDQDMHQKSIVLYSRGLAPVGSRAPMAVFGSSNWTSASASRQEEHNYFTTKPWMVGWFEQQFDRKWNNQRADGTPIGTSMYVPFTPKPPETPVYASPANASTGVDSSAILKWEGGWWAFKYDIYLDVSPTFTSPFVVDYMPGTGTAGVKTTKESYSVTGLQPGTTYYWKIVSKTMANQTKAGPTWSFTTAGSATPPSATGTLGSGDILLYGIDGQINGTTWRKVSDATAAGGQRLWNPNQNAVKVTTAVASPASYVEFAFTAVAGQPYRLWMRGRAENDDYNNDSAFVQFSGAVDASGVAIDRIGTASAAAYVLENCSGCGLTAWGWQDTAYGLNTTPPSIYFATTGTETLRIQQREDGLSIDQILLSPVKFRSTAPGALKNDTTIYPRSDGSASPPPVSTAREIVLYAAAATVTAGAWTVVADPSAAGGRRMYQPNANAAKIVTASATPRDYFDLTFNAEAGEAYRLWMRGRADNDYYGNDSVHVQFSGAISNTGAPVFRIGTTSSTVVNVEDCSGCGLSGWGWQDNGWGIGVLGPELRFASSGVQTIRIQAREDGCSIDQIVLSPGRFLTSAPGSLKNDTTILPQQN